MAFQLQTEQQSVITSLNTTRKQRINTDFKIICRDGVVHAHKWLLIARSPYFKGMLESNMTEANTNTLQFKDVSYQAMKIVISYLYAAEKPPNLSDDFDSTLEVVVCSHMMQMNKLFQFYWDKLSRDLIISNYVEVWCLAEKYEKHETVEKVYDFLYSNLDTLNKSEKLTTLSDKQLKLFIEYIRGRRMTQNILHLILNWGAANIDERMSNTLDLLHEIDLNRFSNTILVAVMNSQGLLLDKCSVLRNYFLKHAFSRLVLSDEKQFQIHLYHLWQTEYGVTSVYNIRENKWTENCFKLKSKTMWKPFVTSSGQEIFCARVEDRKFAAHNSKTNKIIYKYFTSSELVNFDAGFVDGEKIYLRVSVNSFAVFDNEKGQWILLNFPNLKYNLPEKILCIINGTFYFDWITKEDESGNTKSYILTFKTNKFAKIKKPTNDMINIRVKCLRKKCLGKLYFIKGENLFVFDIEMNTWSEQKVPLLESVKPIMANCELNVIVCLKDGNINLFYLDTNKYFLLPLGNLGLSSHLDFSFKC